MVKLGRSYYSTEKKESLYFPRKHGLHEETSNLFFIKAVHEW